MISSRDEFHPGMKFHVETPSNFLFIANVSDIFRKVRCVFLYKNLSILLVVYFVDFE